MSKLSFQERQEILILAMVEQGFLRRVGGEYYEDNGGHVLHESNICDIYAVDFVEHHLDKQERKELFKAMGIGG